MRSDELDKALYNFVNSPRHPMYNFILGYNYEKLGQTTSACSFYLRAAEFSVDDILSYESLLRLAICIKKQGDRVYTLKGIVLRAISLLPKRPEGYCLLAGIYEFNKDWHESFQTSVIGEMMIENNKPELITDVEYAGGYVLTFHKAVAAWWVGLFNESIHLFRQLDHSKEIQEPYKTIIKNNLSRYGYFWKKSLKYEDWMYQDLRYKFPNASTIKENYSQCYQDMFILSILDGKENGSFIEIGCGGPIFNNNTYLLENEFGWEGVSIDIDPETTRKFSEIRKGTVLTEDAVKIDYNKLLDKKEYDYLQIDCDPASISYNILLQIPFETHKFAVITFEHEYYCDPDCEVRELSRKYLQSHGYELVVDDIAEDRFSNFEDWYVHPDLVDRKIVNKMKCVNGKTKKADEYFLK
jgi:SAM-dependent methyltransferase